LPSRSPSVVLVTGVGRYLGGRIAARLSADSSIDRIIGVVKAYTTRVGTGPMPTELHDEDGDKIRQRGNEYGTTTGRPRRCGWLDVVLLRHSARINSLDSLSVMLLDVLSTFPTLKICTGYRTSEGVTDDFPADRSLLDEMEPIFEELSGWSEEITDEAVGFVVREGPRLNRGWSCDTGRLEVGRGTRNSRCSGGMRRDREEHRRRRRRPGPGLTLRSESVGSDPD